MYAKMLCYPPLGESTIVPAGQDSVQFTIVLETAEIVFASSSKQWQVALWHNANSGESEWDEASFDESIHDDEVVSMVLPSSKLIFGYFLCSQLTLYRARPN